MTMSFDRPGLPRAGQKANEVEINEALAGDGVELTDGELDALDRPGAVSEGPVPNPPRRPGDVVAPADGVPVAVTPADGVPVAVAPADGVPAVVEAADPVVVAVEAEEPVDDPAHEDPAREPQG
jgi:hypothetical protein